MRLLLITLAFLASTAALADEPAAPPAAQKFFEVVATVRGSDGSVLVQNHYTPGGKVKLFAGKDACDVFVKNDPDFAASSHAACTGFGASREGGSKCHPQH